MLRYSMTLAVVGIAATFALGGQEPARDASPSETTLEVMSIPNIQLAPPPAPAPVPTANVQPAQALEPANAAPEPAAVAAADAAAQPATPALAAPAPATAPAAVPTPAPVLPAPAAAPAATPTLQQPLSQPLPLLEGSSPCAPQERSYHPICSCDCTVPNLDRWCVWDAIRCDDCWCNNTPCECAQGQSRLTEDGCWVSNDACCDVWGPPVYQANGALRFGYWAIANNGSLQKTGEYQDLHSHPFWDVDTIMSDGCRTWDIVLSGLDQEANDARIHYYGPEGKAKIDFQRFIHRLDHDPIQGFDLAPGQVPPATPAANVIADDLNVGEDYAIRIEELDSKFQGKITKDINWKMNVWSMRKFGERQQNATAHCFNVVAPAAAGATGNTCHVLSQRQSIDWTTVEVQPGIEAKIDAVTVEYTHTLRTFGQDDQMIDRQYSRFNFNLPAASGQLGPEYTYGLVPESTTNIDRLKIGAQITDENQLYANLYYGDTTNEFRELDRYYNGYDLRLTNTAIDDTRITGYASRYEENTSFPPVYLTGAPYSSPNTYDQDSVVHDIDYTRTRAGIKSSWQPYGDRGPRCTNYGLFEGTTLASGYEYYLLERDYATYDTALGPFTQLDTITNQVEFGPSTRWSRSFETFTRYRVKFIQDPLVGVREYNGRFNTNQPEQMHITDVGYTWSPTTNFMTTSQVSIVNSWNDSQYADFTENNYPMSFTAWWAPTCRLSFTGGYAYSSNWIDQDITLGFTTPDVAPPPVVTETTRWAYAGQNHLISFSAHYAWTDNVQLLGGYEYDRGTNTFVVPASPAGADWSLLPSFADVIVETQRLTAGIDYQPMARTNLYFRYVFFDYNDISDNLYSGTSHMFLGGATRTW